MVAMRPVCMPCMDLKSRRALGTCVAENVCLAVQSTFDPGPRVLPTAQAFPSTEASTESKCKPINLQLVLSNGAARLGGLQDGRQKGLFSCAMQHTSYVFESLGSYLILTVAAM